MDVHNSQCIVSRNDFLVAASTTQSKQNMNIINILQFFSQTQNLSLQKILEKKGNIYMGTSEGCSEKTLLFQFWPKISFHFSYMKKASQCISGRIAWLKSLITTL